MNFFSRTLLYIFIHDTAKEIFPACSMCVYCNSTRKYRCAVECEFTWNLIFFFFFCILLFCHPWTWKPEPSCAHQHHSEALRVSSWKGIHHVLGQHSIVSTSRFALFIFRLCSCNCNWFFRQKNFRIFGNHHRCPRCSTSSKRLQKREKERCSQKRSTTNLTMSVEFCDI